MKNSYLITSLIVCTLSASIGIGFIIDGGAREREKNKSGNSKAIPHQIGHPSLMSPHSNPLALHKSRLFVANTPADTVDIINTKQEKSLKESV